VRYFHRSQLSTDLVLGAAKQFFGARMVPAQEAPRRRAYSGSLGKVAVTARPEGGHYTYVEVATDQAGESELDRLARRFLAELHRQAEPGHQLRGAY